MSERRVWFVESIGPLGLMLVEENVDGQFGAIGSWGRTFHLTVSHDRPPEAREGMVTVYDEHGGYLGCMGRERWDRLLTEGKDAA